MEHRQPWLGGERLCSDPPGGTSGGRTVDTVTLLFRRGQGEPAWRPSWPRAPPGIPVPSIRTPSELRSLILVLCAFMSLSLAAPARSDVQTGRARPTPSR